MQIGNMGGIAVAIDLRLEESGGRLDRANILLLLDREADEFIARRADVDLMLVKPVDAGVLRRAAKQLLPPRVDRAMDDHELAARHRARGRASCSCAARAEGASKDDGDRESNDLILARLAEARPDDAVLSEESKDDPIRLERERVWIVDPLDGTREFGEAGRTDWAVHVALVVNGTPDACAVALPAQDDVVLATAPRPTLAPRARREDAAARVAHPAAEARGVPRRACSTPSSCRSVRPARRRWRSCRATPTCTRTRGGQYEWDSAAPVGVAAAAGLPLLAPRRIAARLQPARPVPARPAGVPPGAGRRRFWLRSATHPTARIAPFHTGCSAAWLARSVRDAEVPGSNPGTPTDLTPWHDY